MSKFSGAPVEGLGRAQACERLRAMHVPPAVLEVATRLQEAGHAAVLVGGCVRDVLLGRSHNDWDLASSARPEEVQGLFKRTIGTGIEHGTVTVMVGRGDAREGVEITTFRGETGFDDGRRPNEVVFLRELEDDLARRDFTINAFAWDPVGAHFTDVYEGLADLNAKRIRAVGDPLARFLEDGLRVMRAVRFAATLAFELEAETELAIAGALEVFDKVSRERVQVELFKLLAAAEPSRGLAPMHRQGLWARVLGEPDGEPDYAALATGCDARSPALAVRLSWLLSPLSPDSVESVLDGLKPSRKLRAEVQRLLSPGVAELNSPSTSPAQLRRRCSALGRAHVGAALDFLLADAPARQAVHLAIDGNAIGGKELKLAGRDLIAAGVMKPGRGLGDLLAVLLDAVLEDPTLNTEAQLLDLARARAPEFG